MLQTVLSGILGSNAGRSFIYRGHKESRGKSRACFSFLFTFIHKIESDTTERVRAAIVHKTKRENSPESTEETHALRAFSYFTTETFMSDPYDQVLETRF